MALFEGRFHRPLRRGADGAPGPRRAGPLGLDRAPPRRGLLTAGPSDLDRRTCWPPMMATWQAEHEHWQCCGLADRRFVYVPPGPAGPVSSRDRIDGLLAIDGPTASVSRRGSTTTASACWSSSAPMPTAARNRWRSKTVFARAPAALAGLLTCVASPIGSKASWPLLARAPSAITRREPPDCLARTRHRRRWPGVPESAG